MNDFPNYYLLKIIKISWIMLPNLNYLSRYHRNKNQTDIESLYNLIAGLNLDVIVSSQMSFTLPTPLEESHELKKMVRQPRNKGILGQYRNKKQSSVHRRYMSCKHGDTRQDKIYDNNLMGSKRFIEYDSNNDDKLQEKKQCSFLSNSQQKTPRIHKIITLQEVKNQKQIKSGGNRSLEEMQNLKEAESINSFQNDGNKSDKCPNSPKIVKIAKNPSTENHNVAKEPNNKKISSIIQNVDVKKCQSHENMQSQNLAQQGFSNNQQQNQNPIGCSSHGHREQDIYSEEFIDDINKLARNIEDDRKSTKQMVNAPEYQLQHSKSELLDRMRGSDIQLEDNYQFQQSQYAEFPSTNKKKQQVHEQQDNLMGDEQKEGERNERNGSQSQQQGDGENIEQFEDEEREQQYDQEHISSANPINNLNQIKQTLSEDEDHHQVQKSHIIQRVNFIQSGQTTSIIKEDVENHNISKQSSQSPKRKSFKKVIRNQSLSNNQSPSTGSLKIQNSPINFKLTKKLNPRLVTSTIVPEGKNFHASQQKNVGKKVNFKKALMRGEENRIKTQSSKVSVKSISGEKSKISRKPEREQKKKKLLQAFFEQN